MTVEAQVEALKAKLQKEMEERIATIRTKYPHVKADTLFWDPSCGKDGAWAAHCTCVKCGGDHVRHNGDFFQSIYCPSCRKAVTKEIKAKAKEAMAAFTAKAKAEFVASMQK